jgi:hypothetical protein
MRTYFIVLLMGFGRAARPRAAPRAPVFLRSKLGCSSLQRKSAKNPGFGILKIRDSFLIVQQSNCRALRIQVLG